MAQRGRPILISLAAGVLGDARNDEAIHLLTSGELTRDEQGVRITYDEQLDESQPACHVTLNVGEDALTVRRKGAYETQMVFLKGKRCESQYVTPYGTTDMAVYCTRMRFEMDDDGGEMRLQYQLDFGGSYTAVHELLLQFLFKKGKKRRVAPA